MGLTMELAEARFHPAQISESQNVPILRVSASPRDLLDHRPHPDGPSRIRIILRGTAIDSLSAPAFARAPSTVTVSASFAFGASFTFVSYS